MPFESEEQRRWMWANKPELAKEWERKYGKARSKKSKKRQRKRRKSNK